MSRSTSPRKADDQKRRSLLNALIRGVGRVRLLESKAGLTTGSFDAIQFGQPLRDPSLKTTREGIVVRAIHEEVPDSHTLMVTVTIPQINLDSEPQTAAGFAAVTTVRTSIGGTELVSGPLQMFELRPLAVTASIVEG